MLSRSRCTAGIFLAAAMVLPTGSAYSQTTSYPEQSGVTQSAPVEHGPAPGEAPATESAPTEKPKPKGGCLKYGAAGAVGGHLAHHHAVLGAMGGCAVGSYVKHRSKKHIQETGQP